MSGLAAVEATQSRSVHYRNLLNHASEEEGFTSFSLNNGQGQLLRWMDHTDIIECNGFRQVYFKRW